MTSPRRPRPCHVGLVWVSRGPAPGLWAALGRGLAAGSGGGGWGSAARPLDPDGRSRDVRRPQKGARDRRALGASWARLWRGAAESRLPARPDLGARLETPSCGPTSLRVPGSSRSREGGSLRPPRGARRRRPRSPCAARFPSPGSAAPRLRLRRPSGRCGSRPLQARPSLRSAAVVGRAGSPALGARPGAACSPPPEWAACSGYGGPCRLRLVLLSRPWDPSPGPAQAPGVPAAPFGRGARVREGRASAGRGAPGRPRAADVAPRGAAASLARRGARVLAAEPGDSGSAEDVLDSVLEKRSSILAKG